MTDKTSVTATEFCEHYLAEGVAHKKESTLRSDKGRIKHHIIPLLGCKRVDELTRADLERLLTKLTAGKTAGPKARNGEKKAGRQLNGRRKWSGWAVRYADENYP